LTHSNEHLLDCIVFGLKLQSSAWCLGEENTRSYFNNNCKLR